MKHPIIIEVFLFMQIYQTRKNKLTGTNYKEINKQASLFYNEIKKGSKRKHYIRSKFFNKQKIFFDFFWQHIHDKRPKERVRRLKFLPCAIDLLKHSYHVPITKENPNKKNEILHRFKGVTKNGERFCVQVKEIKKNNKKYLISCFPDN